MKGPAAVPTEAVPDTEAVAGPDGRLQRALRALRDHGLDPRTDARVRLGASLPSYPADRIPPGAEEAPFPPDALLRPLSGSAGACIVELGGAVSSGRTSLAYRTTAEATTRGGLAGWVDLTDALDPHHLRRAGVALDRVLWVRPPTPRAALRTAELLLRTGFSAVILDLVGARPRECAAVGAAAWMRLARAAREARATALVLGTEPGIGSFATHSLHVARERARFDRGLFEGLDGRATVLRTRGDVPGTVLPFRVHLRPAHRPEEQPANPSSD